MLLNLNDFILQERQENDLMASIQSTLFIADTLGTVS